MAKAFNFTSDDLIANRDGILSWRQRGFADWFAYRVLYFLRQLPILSAIYRPASPKKQPRQVSRVCGRIKLEHNIVDRRLNRSSLFYEYYHLVFPGHNSRFPITREQYHSLAENLRYRVFYQDLGARRYILSIERVIGSCDESVS